MKKKYANAFIPFLIAIGLHYLIANLWILIALALFSGKWVFPPFTSSVRIMITNSYSIIALIPGLYLWRKSGNPYIKSRAFMFSLVGVTLYEFIGMLLLQGYV